MITNQQLLAAVKAQPIGFGCGALAVVLGLAIYFRGGLLPEAEGLLDQNATLGERIDANLKNGVQLTEQLAAITAARKQIEARLVRPDELAKNQQFFYKLEAETGIKLIDLRQNQVPAAKPGARGPRRTIFRWGMRWRSAAVMRTSSTSCGAWKATSASAG